MIEDALRDVEVSGGGVVVVGVIAARAGGRRIDAGDGDGVEVGEEAVAVFVAGDVTRGGEDFLLQLFEHAGLEAHEGGGFDGVPAAIFGADGGFFAAIGELTLAEVGEDVAAGFLEDAELFEPIVLALGDEGDAVLDGVLGDAGNVVV